MAKFRMSIAALSIVAAGLAGTTAFAQTSDEELARLLDTPSTEGVVTSDASCEYEGGSVEDLTTGKICFIQIRGEDLSSAAYDGQRLGVIRCEGNGAFANEKTGSFCRVYLEAKAEEKTREQLEAEAKAEMEAELARQQAALSAADAEAVN